MGVRCDGCGGALVMLDGGRGAVCCECGREHSLRRVRAMLGIAAAQQQAPAPQPQSAPQRSGFGIPMEQIAREARYAVKPNLRACAELSFRIAQVLEREFPGYDVRYMADMSGFGCTKSMAYTKYRPVNFLVYKNNRPYLAIMSVTARASTITSYRATEAVCEREGIQYMRFFSTGGYPNEIGYIAQRIRAALLEDTSRQTGFVGHW